MLSEVEARLEGEIAALRLVDTAGAFASLERATPPQIPAAYVLPLDDAAQANPLVNATRQELVERVGVAIATVSRRDRHGGQDAEDVEPLLKSVRAALMGWPPSADHDPFEYRKGRLMYASQGVVWWLAEFETRSQIP